MCVLVGIAGTGYLVREVAGHDHANKAEAQTLHLSWAFDPNDDTRLLDAATDVVVGRVQEQVGAQPLHTSTPGWDLPQTQFSVKVGRRIKGTAHGVVVVNQVGGIDAASGQVVSVEGDALLQTGTKVLLITEFDPTLGWYHLIAAGYSHHRIKDGNQEQRLVERFARAAGVDVPDDSTPTPTIRAKKPQARASEEPSETATDASQMQTPATEVPAITTAEPPATEEPATEEPTIEPTATETAVPTETPTSEPTAVEVVPTETPIGEPPGAGETGAPR